MSAQRPPTLPDPIRVSRRAVVAGGLALAGCNRSEGAAQAAPPRPSSMGPLPPLRQAAGFPVGGSIVAEQLADPSATALLVDQFAQFTPGLELKMEVLLRPDGGFDFAKADAMLAFAQANRLRVHGHTLVWHIHRPVAFERVLGDRAAFANAYRNYILGVAGRYRGRLAGWDVVNEAISHEGDGFRDCIWREAFGMEYVARAFHHAREADPDAILFLNEFNLESMPGKRAGFLRFVESLLKADVPLTGLGTQMHMGYDQDLAAIGTMMRELAGFGLPIHVSELDVSTRQGRLGFASMEQRLQAQARVVGAAAEAFMALPPAQRYAFTFWGLRDRESWLRSPYYEHADPTDRPLPFDDDGRPKLAARAFVEAVSRA